jgi:hypothetical protein
MHYSACFGITSICNLTFTFSRIVTHMFRIFRHLLWELPHNTRNITSFGHSPDINDSHTILTSALLHHDSTLLYVVHISSSLAYTCIIEPNKPLFLSIAAPVSPTNPSQCRVWSKTYSIFCPFDRRVFWQY